MTFANILLLSLIQGITEFIPVSSSAHLMLFPFLLGNEYQGAIVDVFAHMGSLLAVMLFYRKEIKKLVLSLFKKNADRNMLFALIIATMPIVIFGLIVVVTHIKFRSVNMIIYTSIIFGIFLYLADKFGSKKLSIKKMSLKNAFYIGLAQILSAIPGVSRSGITSTCGLMLNYKREEILKFSFLLSIPTIICVTGGGILEFIMKPETISLAPLLSIMFFSFIFSFLTIKFMMSKIKRISFKPFAIYRICLGIFLYIYLK